MGRIDKLHNGKTDKRVKEFLRRMVQKGRQHQHNSREEIPLVHTHRKQEYTADQHDHAHKIF